MKRAEEEFWRARPSQVLFCIEKYTQMLQKKDDYEEVTEITSMKEIQGWGCHG